LSESKARIAKLDRESKLLEQQLSRSYAAREWLKAATGIAAIAALVAAFFQLQGSREQRSEERLDRAITRLASPSANERLAGVSTLRVFVDTGARPEKKIALSALANAVAPESDPLVRGAIFDIIKRADARFLDDIIEELANGSRSLLPPAIEKEPRQAFRPWLVKQGNYGHLQDLGETIVLLIRRGARTSNLTGIYCVQCNFEEVDLSGVDFSGAILNGASFRKATLVGSSFEHAVLLETDFQSADLRQAKFTLAPQNAPGFATLSIDAQGETIWGPDFTCSNLEDADFSRQPLFAFIEEAPNFLPPGQFFTAQFSYANLRRADFRAMGVYGAISSGQQENPRRSALQLREEFPLALDGFQVGEEKESEIPYADGTTKKVGYLPFAGSVNASAPLQHDTRQFKTAFENVARAFANSNWSEARLPNSMQQFLRDAQVPSDDTGRSGHCK